MNISNKRSCFFAIDIGTQILIISFFFFVSITLGCKKVVQISEPYNSITTTETFADDKNAESAIVGIYNDMIKAPKYSSQDITIYTGMSGDEIGTLSADDPLQLNNLLSDNGAVSSLWNGAYFDVFLANSAIEGLEKSTGVTLNLKRQLVGEAKFIRAFCHFYLVNLFGNVPLLTTAEWKNNLHLNQSLPASVYEQIITDLQDAESVLPIDYAKSNHERVRPVKWAASGMLARAYLYIGDYVKAESQATSVINNSSLFALEADLNEVFRANSSEAIWQLLPVYTSSTTNYVAPEPGTLIPSDPSSPPLFVLNNDLIQSFESSDQRKSSWVGTVAIDPDTFYFPFKYKQNYGVANEVPAEYYMVLRLAELYLIRAEARVYQGNLDGAITDLNIIRQRAGLSDLTNMLTSDEIIAAIERERRLEFFSEWGHRWFDVKRWGKADAIFGAFKGSNWQTTDQLYPIPATEIRRNARLVQNPGY